MNREENIARFEKIMEAVKRPGKDALMNYIRKSDFYTAPASTKFHLSCEGGLLQHSLDVFDALVWRTGCTEKDGHAAFTVAGCAKFNVSMESLIIVSLLHDICKTNFYKTEMRNQKTYDPEKVKNASSYQVKKDNSGSFIWEQVPVYAVDDKNPYGHGEKSVMMIEEFMKLTMEERYAIRWHMGMGDCTYSECQAFNASCEKFPLVLFLHNADQEASHFMEDKDDLKQIFREAAQPAADYADQPVFQEATPI